MFSPYPLVFIRIALGVAFCIVTTTSAVAQAPDSVLFWSGFKRVILDNNPLALRANLSVDQAEANLLSAKGGFDPKLYADYYNKSFQSTEYFSYTESGIKWPTWMGLEIKGAYNWATGRYINPENTLPDPGQANLGVRWSLGQGLFIDERRAYLQQAKIGVALGEAERDLLINDLLYEASKAYWNWVLAASTVTVFEQALQRAEIRFEGIREAYLQGDFPAIDTLEAYIQVQNRLLDLNDAKLAVQNTGQYLRNFLWNDQQLPIQPAAQTIPPFMLEAPGPFLPPMDSLASSLESHPELRQYSAKLSSLDVERRYKQELRKPVLDIEYNLLGNGWQFFPTGASENTGYLTNDIKWGVQFSYPILNRKARGAFQVNTIKTAQTELQFRQKRLELETKMRNVVNELENLRKQVAVYKSVSDNYLALLEGENEKFRFGESSVFLVNAREQRWLEAQTKLLKLTSEYRKTEAALLWSAGQLKYH